MQEAVAQTKSKYSCPLRVRCAIQWLRALSVAAHTRLCKDNDWPEQGEVRTANQAVTEMVFGKTEEGQEVIPPLYPRGDWGDHGLDKTKRRNDERCVKDQTKSWVRQLLAADSIQDPPRKRKRELEEDDKTFEKIKKVMRAGYEDCGGAKRMFRNVAHARNTLPEMQVLCSKLQSGRGMQNRSIWSGLKCRYP